VAPSTNTEEPIQVDILLCQLMNKLHPGMIQYIYEEVWTVLSLHLITVSQDVITII